MPPEGFNFICTMENEFNLSDFSVKYQDDVKAEYSTEKEFIKSLKKHPTEMIKWLAIACGYEGGKTSNLILENGKANKWDVKSDGKFSSIFCYTGKEEFLTEFKNYLRNYFDSLIFKYPNFTPPPGPAKID
jgi:hypothetical protein